MSQVDAFAYFVENEELPRLVSGWPETMRLAICLDAGGECELVIFHRDEEDALQRVAQVLRRPACTFAVTPEVDGYPTRRLLFSEESELLAIVRAAEGLAELASDYAINFNFAREEGLDPDAVMSARQPEKAERPAKIETAMRAHAGKIFVARKRTAPRCKSRNDLPQGYTRIADGASPDCHFIHGTLSVSGGRLRLAAGVDGGVRAAYVPMLARDVAFRDDFAAFYLQRNMLPGAWTPSEGLLLDVPAELFPAGFLGEATRRAARISVTPGGIFVEPDLLGMPDATEQPEKPSSAAARPDSAPVPVRRSGWRLAAALTAVAVLGAGSLVTTVVPHDGPARQMVELPRAADSAGPEVMTALSRRTANLDVQ